MLGDPEEDAASSAGAGTGQCVLGLFEEGGKMSGSTNVGLSALGMTAPGPAPAPAPAPSPAPMPQVPAPNPAVLELARLYADTDESKTSVLTADSAILIFTSRAAKSSKLRDSSSSKLAHEHGVTTKAVRDIWNMRTWVWTTMPYWSDEDMRTFLRKRTCKECKAKGVERIEVLYVLHLRSISNRRPDYSSSGVASHY